MRKLTVMSLSLAALAFTGSAVMAADLPTKPVQMVVAPQPADLFSGWWVGVEVGGSWASIDPDVTNVRTIDANGWAGGASLGYRSRVAAGWYLGLVTALDYESGSKTITPATNVNVKGSNLWSGRTMVQVGFLVTPAMLVYGEGGVAYGATKAKITAGAFSVSDTERGVGWALGGGLDVSLANWGWQNSTMGVEYVYSDLGKIGYNFNVGGGGFGIGTHARDTESKVMANWKVRFGS